MSTKAEPKRTDAGRHINTVGTQAENRKEGQKELKPVEDRTVEWEKEMVSLGK